MPPSHREDNDGPPLSWEAMHKMPKTRASMEELLRVAMEETHKDGTATHPWSLLTTSPTP